MVCKLQTDGWVFCLCPVKSPVKTRYNQEAGSGRTFGVFIIPRSNPQPAFLRDERIYLDG